MILSCPACSAQFLIDPNALGASGRSVRCGKCKHQWLATRPLITMPAQDLSLQPKGVEPIPEGSSLPVFAAEVQKTASRNGLIAGLVLGALFALPVFVINTGHLLSALQGPAKSEVLEDKEIVLDGTPTTLLKEELGRTVLNIEGAVINKTKNSKTVPVLKAQALNAKGKVVKEWVIPLTVKDMEPGQRQSFSFSTPFSEQGVVDIAFHFM